MSEYSEQSPIEQYQAYAVHLDAMQAAANDGRGIEHVRWIVDDLRRGNFHAAQVNYRNQSDKFDRYPDILQYLKEIGIVEERKFS